VSLYDWLSLFGRTTEILGSVTLPEGLILVGGVLELAGLGTVALDIALIGRELRKFEKRPIVIRVGPAIVSMEAFGVGVVTGQPTLAERVERLEEGVSKVEKDIRDAKSVLRKEWRNELSESIGRASEAAKEDNQALASLLRGVTKGGFRLRIVGVVLLAGGIVCSVTGGLLL
jgi:hypothetical protein